MMSISWNWYMDQGRAWVFCVWANVGTVRSVSTVLLLGDTDDGYDY
jgi:hypothetical protein